MFRRRTMVLGVLHRRISWHFITAPAAVVVVLSVATVQAAVVYVSEWQTGTISTSTPSGGQLTFAMGLSEPAGIAFDASGNLFEADAGSGTIYMFTPTGVKSVFASGLGEPYGIAINSSGNIFVSDGASPQHLQVHPFRNQSTIASGFLFPLGLAFDTADNLFVADFNRIDKITPNGTVSQFASAEYGACDLAFAPDGNLFLTNDQPDVFKYTPTGSRSLFGTVPNRSGSVAVDASGNVFVGDRVNGTIYDFTPAGVGATFATGLHDPQGGIAFANARTFQPRPPRHRRRQPVRLRLATATTSGVGLLALRRYTAPCCCWSLCHSKHGAALLPAVESRRVAALFGTASPPCQCHREVGRARIPPPPMLSLGFSTDPDSPNPAAAGGFSRNLALYGYAQRCQRERLPLLRPTWYFTPIWTIHRLGNTSVVIHAVGVL